MGLLEGLTQALGFGSAQERSPEELARLRPELDRLALYHFRSCPYCVRVRHAIARLGLEIEERDIRADRGHLEDLRAGGGKTQVPSLRIEEESGEVRWLYESEDIVRYLESRFGRA